MYLNKLVIKNFKSYIDENFDFKKITLLTGLNSSGKSSIFQSIRMFWQYNLTGNPIIKDYGLIHTLKNENTSDKFIQISLEIEENKLYDLYFDINDIKNISCKKLNNSSIDCKDFILSYISASRLGPTKFQELRNNLEQEYSVGVNGEYTLDILYKYRDEPIPSSFNEDAEKNTLFKYVEKYLQIISPNTKLDLFPTDKNDSSFFTINGYTSFNVGFGLSYTLSILVQLLYSITLLEKGKKSILLIENPEAHLHPKGQTELAKLISKVAKFGVQIIIETHSDYILDGLRLAVKEGLISKEETRIYYLELEKGEVGDYNTKKISPEIQDNGHLNEWPENFFDTSINNKMQLI